LAGAFFSVLLVLVVAVIAVVLVPLVPIVPIVPEVPEVSVDVIVPIVDDVSVAIVDVVDVVAETLVFVAAVSVLVFSSFLHPNANRAIASSAKSVSFFILELSYFVKLNPGITAEGLILETPLTMSSDPARLETPASHSVVSFDGTPIAYDIYPGRSRMAVLVIPGFWRERKHPSMVRVAALLNRHGYTAAVTDPRGHGDSGGTYGFNLHEHEDTAAVAKDLLGRGAESITMVGFSYGAAVAISTVARHPLPFNALLLISPVADASMISPRINPFTIHQHIALAQVLHRPRFEWRARKSPKLRALDDVRDVHVPICLIHVRNDWLISHKHSVALYEAANEPKELHVIDIPGAYHADRIFRVASDSIEPIFLDFLSRTR